MPRPIGQACSTSERQRRDGHAPAAHALGRGRARRASTGGGGRGALGASALALRAAGCLPALAASGGGPKPRPNCGSLGGWREPRLAARGGRSLSLGGCRRGGLDGRRRLFPAGRGLTPLLPGLDEVEKLALGLRRIGRRAARRVGWRCRQSACAGISLAGGGLAAEATADLDLAGAQAFAARARDSGGRARAWAPAPAACARHVGDRLRPLADLEPQRLVDGGEEGRAIGAERRLARRHVLVVDHARGRVGRALAGDGVIERARRARRCRSRDPAGGWWWRTARRGCSPA